MGDCGRPCGRPCSLRLSERLCGRPHWEACVRPWESELGGRVGGCVEGQSGRPNWEAVGG